MMYHKKAAYRTFASGRMGGDTCFLGIFYKKDHKIPLKNTKEFESLKEAIYNAQIELGYHPNGYGGPFHIKEISTQNSFIVITWSCFGSCD